MQTSNQTDNSNLSLKNFLSDLISETFGVEGRLPKTIRTLLFNPGELTKFYIAGSTKKYISPMSLYFTLNLLFFLLLPIINSKSIKFLSFSYSGFTKAKGFFSSVITSDLSKSNLSIEVYKSLFDAHITYNQPALIFFIIPFFALLLKLVEAKNKRYYVEHLVFSFHFMSFFLILFFISAASSSLLIWIISKWFEVSNLGIPVLLYVILIFISLFLVYLFLALRKYYKHNTVKSIFKTLLLFIGFIIIFMSYIFFIFFQTILSVG